MTPVSDGQEIRYVNLHNGGGFVTRIRIVWDFSKAGNDAHGEYNMDKDITLGLDKTLDLTTTKIPDGATVTLKAFVVWGKDNTASQHHTFKSSSTKTAYYTITGTTLSNSLGEIKIE
ncbi:MAG: hypothetical protein LBK82_12050 [Planctomycetaceae bacterium]|jgi:hypothetical protein|nr:hypothetical protein [Planctomycetaceae bacterium]